MSLAHTGRIMADRIPITGTLFISEGELTERFVQAGGPGGQAVNKLATAVQLRFPLWRSGLPDRVKRRAAELAGSRLNVEGEIVIDARRHRSREVNREDARERLVALLKEAAKPPPPKRKPTKPSWSARKKRTDRKVQRGAVKKLRGPVSLD